MQWYCCAETYYLFVDLSSSTSPILQIPMPHRNRDDFAVFVVFPFIAITMIAGMLAISLSPPAVDLNPFCAMEIEVCPWRQTDKEEETEIERIPIVMQLESAMTKGEIAHTCPLAKPDSHIVLIKMYL